MGFFNRFGGGNTEKMFQQEMVNLGRVLLREYLTKKGISLERLGELDRQVLMIYLFGLVAAVNVKEQRGLDNEAMGRVEVEMLQETFHLPKRMARVCAHDVVEQTKTGDAANPIYGIVSRAEQIWPMWHQGQISRVVQDMEEMVQFMQDLQNNVPAKPLSEKTALPTFRYHPNLYEGEDVVYGAGVCQCCGKAVDTYVRHLYCEEAVDCICLDCVQSGRAVEKFGGEFIQNVEKIVDDPERTEELLHRTPGYTSYQGEYWLTCCEDYCAYLGRIGTDELDALGITQEVCEEYEHREDCLSGSVRDLLMKEGPVTGYLFRCLHCGHYHLWVDVE